MFCLSCATRIFTVVTWPEPKFECGLFSSAAPICRSMLQQSQELFKIRTQMPKTLWLQDAELWVCKTGSCLGGDLQHWSSDNLSLRCSLRAQKKRGLCKGSFRSALERSPGKGFGFHWPTWNGSFVWGIPRVKPLCCFPLVGMREAKLHRNK